MNTTILKKDEDSTSIPSSTQESRMNESGNKTMQEAASVRDHTSKVEHATKQDKPKNNNAIRRNDVVSTSSGNDKRKSESIKSNETRKVITYSNTIMKRKGMDPPSMHKLVKNAAVIEKESKRSAAGNKLEPKSTNEIELDNMKAKDIGIAVSKDAGVAVNSDCSAHSQAKMNTTPRSVQLLPAKDGNSQIKVDGNTIQNLIHANISKKSQVDRNKIQTASVGLANTLVASSNLMTKRGSTSLKNNTNMNIKNNSVNGITNVKTSQPTTATASTLSNFKIPIPQCNVKMQQIKSVPAKTMPFVSSLIMKNPQSNSTNISAAQKSATLQKKILLPIVSSQQQQSQLNQQLPKGLSVSPLPSTISQASNLTKESTALSGTKVGARKHGSLVTNLEYLQPSKKYVIPSGQSPPISKSLSTVAYNNTGSQKPIPPVATARKPMAQTAVSIPKPMAQTAATEPKTAAQAQYISPKPTSNKRHHSQISSHHQHQYLSSSQKRKKFRTPLSDMYHPYVQSTDTNLADARRRLQTALEQTRILRLAFTCRVYEKYRMILRMQSLSLKTEDIVALIKKDPKAYFESLMKDMDSIHGEKELEKKEAQKWNTELNATSGVPNEKNASSSLHPLGNLNAIASPAGSNLPHESSPMMSPSMKSLFDGIENTEQLSWFTSGLSLVILPEEEVNEIEEQFEQRNITHRSPVDIQTGHKVKDISPAAAMAAGVMLDRVRKGKELRSIRRKQAGLDDNDDTFGSINLSNLIDTSSLSESGGKALNIDGSKKIDIYSSIYQGYTQNIPIDNGNKATSSTKQPQSYLQQGDQSSSPLPYSFLSKVVSPIKKSSSRPRNLSTPSKSSAASDSANVLGTKHARPRVSNSLVTLLSLSPTIEGRRKSGKLSACASALVTNGISHIPSSKKGGSTSFGHGGFYNHHQRQQRGSSSPVDDSVASFSSSPLSMRFKHPFPSSRGARSMTYCVSGALSHLQSPEKNLNQTPKLERDDSLLLPPLMTSVERKKQKLENLTKFEQSHWLISDKCADAVNTALHLFDNTHLSQTEMATTDNKTNAFGDDVNKTTDSEELRNILCESSVQFLDLNETDNGSKLLRRASKNVITADTDERSNQIKPAVEKSNKSTSTDKHKKEDISAMLKPTRHISDINVMNILRNKKLKLQSDHDKNTKESIDPILALSVLNAVGYTSRKSKQMDDVSKTTKNPFSSIQDQFNQKLGLRYDEYDGADESTFISRPTYDMGNLQILSQQIQQLGPQKHITECKNDYQESEIKRKNDLSTPQKSGIKLASYIPSLRGGGEGSDSPNKDQSSDKSEMNKFGSALPSFQNTSHGSVSQNQLHTQHLNNNDLLNAAAALWNEQNRTDLAMLHAQAASMSHHTQPGIDMYSLLPGMQSSNNQVNLLPTGSLQLPNHRSLPNSISGAHDQSSQASNASLSNQLHLAQNRLQPSPLLHNHFLQHQTSDLNKYLNATLRQPQISTNFASRQGDWSSLGTHSILAGNHHPTSMLHSGIDPSRLSLSSQQAALLMRERATQVLLARGQQELQNRVATAQRNVAAFEMGSGSGSGIEAFNTMQSLPKQASPKNIQGNKFHHRDKKKFEMHHLTRPTTAPAPSAKPRSDENVSATSIMGEQRPSTVPASPSKISQSNTSLLSNIDSRDCHKLSESPEKVPDIKKIENATPMSVTPTDKSKPIGRIKQIEDKHNENIKRTCLTSMNKVATNICNTNDGCRVEDSNSKGSGFKGSTKRKDDCRVDDSKRKCDDSKSSTKEKNECVIVVDCKRNCNNLKSTTTTKCHCEVDEGKSNDDDTKTSSKEIDDYRMGDDKSSDDDSKPIIKKLNDCAVNDSKSKDVDSKTKTKKTDVCVATEDKSTEHDSEVSDRKKEIHKISNYKKKDDNSQGNEEGKRDCEIDDKSNCVESNACVVKSGDCEACDDKSIDEKKVDDNKDKNVQSKTTDVMPRNIKPNGNSDGELFVGEKALVKSQLDNKKNSKAGEGDDMEEMKTTKDKHSKEVEDLQSGEDVVQKVVSTEDNGIGGNEKAQKNSKSNLHHKGKEEKGDKGTQSENKSLQIQSNIKEMVQVGKATSTIETSIVEPKTSTKVKTSFISPDSEKVDEKHSDLIMNGFFHLATSCSDSEMRQGSMLEFLLAAGSAIPLPNQNISDILDDDTSFKDFKSQIPAENLSAVKNIISAVICIWLWANWKDRLSKLSQNSDALKSDNEYKWLLRASVEVAVRGLNEKRLQLSKNKESPNDSAISVKSKVEIASLASKSLALGLNPNEDMDMVLPNFDALVDHLDELRMFSLRIRSQERALLASLVSRRCRMSEAFSHAYTSSMVRAGEALGYDDLGEIVQDETTKTSSLLPFDILSDVSRAWEDPCRPICGFVPGFDSDELFKRAHARAIIQKSLKKLQDRHQIKGGTGNAGPYADIQPSDQGKLSIKAANGVSSVSPPKSSPRSSSATKRKASIPSNTEGIGTSLFHPNHYSSPFGWDPTQEENTPYGRASQFGSYLFSHQASKRPRLGSVCGETNLDGDDLMNDMDTCDNDDANCSTREIEWSHVANMFRPVLVQERSSTRIADNHHSVAVPTGSTIIAPFCRKLSDSEELCAISDEDDGCKSETEEDLDDEKILESHQKILDHIREKFDAMMQVRQEIQERQRRARST